MSALGKAIASSVAVSSCLVAAPAASGADMLGALQDLVQRPVHPTPLVPTALPAKLGPLGTVEVQRGAAARSGGYALIYIGADLKLKMTLVRGDWASLRQLDKRRTGLDRVSPLKVRGAKGELRTARHGKAVELAWTEGGRVFELASSSRTKITAKNLQTTAKSLDKLGRAWSGGSQPDGLQSAVAVTTAHTITIYVEWVGTCAGPPDSYGGSGTGVLLPIRGGAFSAANLPSGTSSASWTNQVSGTVAPATVQLGVHAQTTFNGVGCDTGQVSFPLTPLPASP